jgi:protein-S-isoprenylcysteine O-methyltransferase Ste14
MIRRLIVQNVLWLGAMGAILFLAAGTLRWRAGWAFIAIMVVVSFAGTAWLYHRDPALLAERMASPLQQGQAKWDKLFILTFMPLMLLWLAVMPLDAVRYRISDMPVWLQWTGALMIVGCMVLVVFTFRENTYAAPVVRVQSERGHHVVTTGPYGYVRHPMYSGALLYLAGVPLLLGSWIGLAMTPLFIAMLGARTIMEERTLMTGLRGYADYAARVRYRFMPGIW